MPGPGDTTVNKTKQDPCTLASYPLGGKQILGKETDNQPESFRQWSLLWRKPRRNVTWSEQHSRGAAGSPWLGGRNQSPEEPGSLTSCYISRSPLIPSHFPPTLGTRDGDTNEERGELIFQYSLTSLGKDRQKGNTGMSTSTGGVESGLERPWEVVSNWKG